MADNDNKTEKKQMPKRNQMSGLAALRQNVGVKPKEEVKLDVVEIDHPKENIVPLVPLEQPEKEITEAKGTELPLEQTLEVSNEPKVKELLPIKGKPNTDINKPAFEYFLRRTDVTIKKETVNISTKNKECIKLMANLEKSTINSVIENVIDWFFESYNEDIVKIPGMKDILKKYRK